MRTIVMAGVAVLGLAVVTPAWAELVLVRDGKAQATLVVPAKAPLEIAHAAQELAEYVRRASGATLPQASSAEGAAIRLEVDAKLNPLPAGRKEWPGARGYRLIADSSGLRIVGADPLGVLHGTYAFLERHLGIRWLWPGELGEVVPEKHSIVLPAIDEVSAPDFAVRWVGSGPWALRHGANAFVTVGRQPIGVKWKWHFHTFDTLIPAEKYFDQHPNWWPLVEGKRQRPTQPHSHSTQLCTSNPELVAELTRNLIAVLDAEPDTQIIALSPNDGGGFCECPQCQALDEPGRDWFARYSKRLAVLNQAVSQAVAQRHPGVLIKIGAYAMYLRRPLDEGLRPSSNQLVQICHIYCCHNHPISGQACREGQTFENRKGQFLGNDQFEKILLDWRRVTDHLFIYEYYTLGGPSREGLPWPMVHTLRHDMPLYRRIGAEGFYTQLTETMFHRYGLNYFLAAKLAWNAGQDVDALMADYCRNAFGPASSPMLRYFQRLEQAMVDSDRCLSYGLESPQVWGPKIFSPAVMSAAGNDLAEAMAAVSSGRERERVVFFQKGYDEAKAGLAAKASPPSKTKPASLKTKTPKIVP